MFENASKTYLKLMPQMLLASLLTGFFSYFFFQPAITNFYLGLLIGFQAHLYISTFEIYIKPKLTRRNFFLALLTGTLAYTVLIVLAVFVSIIILNKFRFTSILSNFNSILFSSAMGYGLMFGLIMSFLFSLYAMFEMLLGRNFLFKLFTGKYHRPFEEERVFMFIDLKASTTVAEKLGSKIFLSFLNDFMYDISQPVLNSRGEIYKYVGDGAIITWKIKYAQRKANPVVCFFQIKAMMEESRSSYVEKYGVVPEIKAGVHGGFVVTGEMGHIRKEIAFMGDVVNTASRIESMCNQLKVDFLISDEILKNFRLPEGYEIVSLGQHVLKGKEAPVKLSTIRLHQ